MSTKFLKFGPTNENVCAGDKVVPLGQREVCRVKLLRRVLESTFKATGQLGVHLEQDGRPVAVLGLLLQVQYVVVRLKVPSNFNLQYTVLDFQT